MRVSWVSGTVTTLTRNFKTAFSYVFHLNPFHGNRFRSKQNLCCAFQEVFYTRQGVLPTLAGCPSPEPPPPPRVCVWMPLVNGTGNSPSLGQPTPGVVKQDKSSRGSVDTTKTRSGPQRVRMSSGERPIGAAKGKQIDTEALCQPPPPPRRIPMVVWGAGRRASQERMRKHGGGARGAPGSGRGGRASRVPLCRAVKGGGQWVDALKGAG